MLVNSEQIEHLAWLDSVHFDKEGLLLVKHCTSISSVHTDPCEYVARLVRLKANLLFILSIDDIPHGNNTLLANSDSSYERNQRILAQYVQGLNDVRGRLTWLAEKLNHLRNCSSELSNSRNNRKLLFSILLLQEVAVREESAHCQFSLHFASLEGSDCCIQFACASDKQRDNWLRALCLAQGDHLRAIFRALCARRRFLLENTEQQKQAEFKTFSSDSESESEKSNTSPVPASGTAIQLIPLPTCAKKRSLAELQKSTCATFHVNVRVYAAQRPNLQIKLLVCQSTHGWQSLGSSEILDQLQGTFAKNFLIPTHLLQSGVTARVKLFDVVELLTQTKILLAESILQLNNETVQTFSLKACCSADQIIGDLTFELNSDLATIVEKPKINWTEKGIQFTMNSSITEPAYMLDPHMFTNHIHRSFQFELPDTKCKINITELMSEPLLSLVLPQTIMNFFMDDEKKLMNCITYSLGEVKAPYQRKQMQALESHLRLVNLITESINGINQEQMCGKYFRPSTEKKPMHFQFVPVNLHLQRSIFTEQNHNGNADLNSNMQKLSLAVPTLEEDQPEQRPNILNVFTHGAFYVHALDSEHGMEKSMRDLLSAPKNSSSAPPANAWKSMISYFKILRFGQQISQCNSIITEALHELRRCQELLISSISEQEDQKTNITQLLSHQQRVQRRVASTFAELEKLCEQISNVLDAKNCEEVLSRLDEVRSTPIRNEECEKSESSIERTVSCPVDQLQHSVSALKQAETVLARQRKSSSTQRLDELTEFEPVELIQLNIRASIISMQSKLNQLSKLRPDGQLLSKVTNKDQEKNSLRNTSDTVNINPQNGPELCVRLVEELQPCLRKLNACVQSFQRTASVCYALHAMNASRDQLDLLYRLRLRRNALFSQALSTFIIALLAQLDGDLITRCIEQKTIVCFFEGTLSCYAEEIPILQDMQYAMLQLANCVKIRFINSAFWPANSASMGNWSQANLLATQGSAPRLEGNGHYIHIVIPICDPHAPDSFECCLIPLFFNIGINENATLGETFGQVKVQEEINRSSFFRLEEFVANCANIENANFVQRMAALRNEVFSGRAKNVRILRLIEQIAYDLNALRFSNCKSGKDRTAMAITLEQVQRAGDLFYFSEISHQRLFQQMLDTLRSEGTRRENTRKNVGVAKYAFNGLRVMTLPKLYRPPQGTYGNVQT